MDIEPGLLLFLFIFFVLPLIQRVLRGATKQAPPGSQPGQRSPGVPPGQAEGRVERSAGAPADRPDVDEPRRAQVERAADLIPDDLWEILTGQRRSPAPTQRQPAPEQEPTLEGGTEWQPDAGPQWEREPAAAHLPDFAEEDPYQEEEPLETPWHHESEEAAQTVPANAPEPALASDDGSPTNPARFAQWREVGKGIATRRSPYLTADTDASNPYGSPPRSRRATQRRVTPALSSRSELKRAFVLREVLGPPKALE